VGVIEGAAAVLGISFGWVVAIIIGLIAVGYLINYKLGLNRA